MNNVKRRRVGTGVQRNRNNSKPQRGKGIDVSKFINKNLEIPKQEAYTHIHGFSDFLIHPDLLQRICDKGYVIPTEIQDKTIPQIMSGQDIVGIAGTGTGKTAAFLIPIIQGLLENNKENKALVITPTRELATQIYDEFRALTKGMNLYATCLIGGNPVHKSISDLQKVNHLIIGTPGRLVDMANRNHLKFNQFEILVLDEFDRMLDMGFVDEILDINKKMTKKSQTLLFSATMDKSIKSIVNTVSRQPIEVKAGAGTQLSTSIDQDVLHVPKDKNKFDVLQDLIFEWENQKIILFCETKRKVDQVHKKLISAGIKTDVIHGDKSQRAREVALRKFKNGQIHVLVATDVVARGIDVSDVSLVINFEAPQSYNDYIHRIGRTGRAGKIGKAITLID